MITAPRDHFVYRIFDAAGRVLYIGCTKNLEQRWQQHRYERPAVVLEAARCELRGPFVKAKARQVEADEICSRRPLFNGMRNGGLPRREQARRNVIAAYKLGIRPHYPASCPARDILAEAGLTIEVDA